MKISRDDLAFKFLEALAEEYRRDPSPSHIVKFETIWNSVTSKYGEALGSEVASAAFNQLYSGRLISTFTHQDGTKHIQINERGLAAYKNAVRERAMRTTANTRTPFYQKAWFHIAALVAAVISAIFQVTGPVPAAWLKAIPDGLSFTFQHGSQFLARYGVYAALFLILGLGYLKRVKLLRGGSIVARACLGIYIQCAALFLRPVVEHILALSLSPTSTRTMCSQPRAVSTLRILAANYGAQGKFNEVAELLNESIKEGRRELFVCNNNLGGDSIHGTEKRLTVDYWHSGTRLSKTVKENDMLSLP